ncbi:MAG TPA: ABC transporter permease [Candidatus Angelobacter sp.]|nr:ABC transporter permease [Candidatus Angelobacter sp.]
MRNFRSMLMLENILQDLRYGLRMLRKNPGFTFVAATVLALGIGANTAIFSIVDVVLFRPLPVSDSNELVRIFSGETRGNASWGSLSLPEYQEYHDRMSAFSGLAAYVDRFPANVSAGKFGTERVDAGMVTGNYFHLLGTNPEFGRNLLPDDDKKGAAPVAMLGYQFWKRHFPSDATVLGSQLLIDGQWFTVVGVTQPGFGGVSFENFPEIWIPLTQGIQIDPLLKSQIPQNHKSFVPFAIVARLKPGVSATQAQAQLDALAEQLGAGKLDPSEGPDWKRAWPVLVPVTQAARQANERFSFLLLGIVALVLLIACADVAALMLARSENRQKEIAVRLALGGSRQRIMMLHLSEALLISGLGAVFGLALAAWATRLIVLTAPSTLDLPLDRASSLIDLRVLAFTALAALASALISALVPALKYSRSELVAGIKSDSGRASAIGRGFSAQAAMVVLQLAASVVLLVGAGLLARTIWHASQVRLGFDPEHTVSASTDLVRQGYDKNVAITLLGPLLDSLRSQAGVESAALGPPPMTGNMWTSVKLESHISGDGKKAGILGSRISPDYFKTVHIPLLQGRDFTRSDSANAPGVAIVSDSFARKYWPHESALGKHIEQVGIHDQTFEVVGIVGDTANQDLRREPPAMAYFPLAQSYLMFPWQPDVSMLARGPGDSRELIGSMRKAVAGVNSALPVFRARTLKEQVAAALGQERFLARLLLAFALVAILLAGAGVFGLMSYSTARATHDFGIRMALGAQAGHVLWLVLKKGLTLAAIGLVLGLGAALWLTRLIVSLLFGVSRNDAPTFAAVAAVTLLAALSACYLPARRATRVDPLEALRNE